MSKSITQTTAATKQPAEPAKARAVVKYNPNDSIGNPGGLRRLLADQAESLAQVLPNHVTPERLAKTMLVAANRNPKIYQCTIASVIETITRAAELGLDLSGTLGECYPVPFNNKVKVNGREEWLNQLQLIIGYRGLEKLAWQTGQMVSIDAEVVCENDEFTFSKGTKMTLKWSPFLGGDRGKIIGAYCCIAIKDGGKLARFLPLVDLEKIRNASQSKNSPAWTRWPEEMYRKCAIKRTLKDAPLSTEKLNRALEYDDADTLSDVLSASTRRGRDLTLPAGGDADTQLLPMDDDGGQVDDVERSDAAEPTDAELAAAGVK